MQSIIEARGVCQTVAGRQTLENLQFEIKPGECFGVVGSAGAGKTALLRLMAGIWPPTKGELFVLGLNTRENARVIREKIGLVPESDCLEAEFTVLDNLLSFAAYFGLSGSKVLLHARALLRDVHLDDSEDRMVNSLSVAQRRRLSLARSLVANPKLLLVDQPTAGLDPQQRDWTWRWLKTRCQDGLTVVVATQFLEEAERLCDRIILLKNGRVVLQGRPESLILDHVGREVVEIKIAPSDLEYHINQLRERYQYQVLGDRIRIFLSGESQAIEAARVLPSENIHIRRASLHDVTSKVLGYDLEGGAG